MLNFINRPMGRAVYFGCILVYAIADAIIGAMLNSNAAMESYGFGIGRFAGSMGLGIEGSIALYWMSIIAIVAVNLSIWSIIVTKRMRDLEWRTSSIVMCIAFGLGIFAITVMMAFNASPESATRGMNLLFFPIGLQLLFRAGALARAAKTTALVPAE